MSSESENNKRVMKNTLVLYVRMFFTMAVGFYMSRVILVSLGVEDYGIYNVVGGVTAMFSFLNSSLSGATSRFLTYELGEGNMQRMKATFSVAYTIHVLLAILIFFICETVGLWLLEYKLVIPEARMNAARVLYQLSVITVVVSIIQVPFNALIIAHERMNAFAYLSIIDMLLKLGVALSLDFIPFDKLITYGLLFFLVGNTMRLMYRWYARKHFEECIIVISKDKNLILPMLKFSGWDLYGNLSTMARTQGVNILQNMFFGPLINAAAGVSGYVMGAVLGFSNKFKTAVIPQIIKLYAQKKIDEMQRLVERGSRMAFFLLFFVSFPCFIELPFVLNFWLEEVPVFTDEFTKLSLFWNWSVVLFFPLSAVIHATGKVKRISLLNGTLYLLVIPITYFFFKFTDCTPLIPYICNAILGIIGCFINLQTVKMYVPAFSVTHYLIHSTTRAILAAVVGSIVPICAYMQLSQGWVGFAIVCLLCIISNSLSILYIGMSKDERVYVIDLLLRKVHLKE